jgi:hypothetical protein
LLDDNISQARRFAEEKSHKERRKKSIGASHRLMPPEFSLIEEPKRTHAYQYPQCTK